MRSRSLCIGRHHHQSFVAFLTSLRFTIIRVRFVKPTPQAIQPFINAIVRSVPRLAPYIVMIKRHSPSVQHYCFIAVTYVSGVLADLLGAAHFMIANFLIRPSYLYTSRQQAGLRLGTSNLFH